MSEPLLIYGAFGSLAASTAIVAYQVAATPPAVSPHLGRRGLVRQRALQDSTIFRRIEPMMLFVAALFARLPLTRARADADEQLTESGDWLGLSPDEYFALSVLGLLAGLSFGLLAGDGTPVLPVAGAGIGAVYPRTRLSGRIRRRKVELGRGLPGAIDLIALCLGAGLDFPGAIRQVILGAGKRRSALVDELVIILRELHLGYTRRAALESFAARANAPEIRDFVAAVVQAEERGNPLADVLRIQAEVLRQRRTVRGEEAAARASVFMIAPLVMLILSVMVVVIAPLMMRAASSFGGAQ
jgi:tight adherence protein C